MSSLFTKENSKSDKNLKIKFDQQSSESSDEKKKINLIENTIDLIEPQYTKKITVFLDKSNGDIVVTPRIYNYSFNKNTSISDEEDQILSLTYSWEYKDKQYFVFSLDKKVKDLLLLNKDDIRYDSFKTWIFRLIMKLYEKNLVTIPIEANNFLYLSLINSDNKIKENYYIFSIYCIDISTKIIDNNDKNDKITIERVDDIAKYILSMISLLVEIFSEKVIYNDKMKKILNDCNWIINNLETKTLIKMNILINYEYKRFIDEVRVIEDNWKNNRI